MAARRLRRRRRRRNLTVVRTRRILDRSNPLEGLSDSDIFNRYRFFPVTIFFLVDLLKDNLQFDNLIKNNPLTPLHQVLVALRFFATGSFYITVGDTLNVSKSAAGRAIRAVTDLLCHFVKRFIKFPSQEELVNVKTAFHKIAGFPGVVGCTDGTIIKIQAPKDNESDYVCRKGYHALNIQMTCDTRYRITDLVAKWPGSVHDSRIFRESALCRNMEEGRIQGMLLGDSGYGLKPFMMTPYISVDTEAARRYNTAHCRTRVIIEQTYGILKKRFNALHSGLRTGPARACRVITACAILHNIGIERGDILKEVPPLPTDATPTPDVVVPDDAIGRTVRDHIRDTYFQA